MSERIPFDENDPFQQTIEDLRQTLILWMDGFMNAHSTFKSLPADQQVQVLIIAFNVTLFGLGSIYIDDEGLPKLKEAISSYLDEALTTARELILDGERRMAGGSH